MIPTYIPLLCPRRRQPERGRGPGAGEQEGIRSYRSLIQRPIRSVAASDLRLEGTYEFTYLDKRIRYEIVQLRFGSRGSRKIEYVASFAVSFVSQPDLSFPPNQATSRVYGYQGRPPCVPKKSRVLPCSPHPRDNHRSAKFLRRQGFSLSILPAGRPDDDHVGEWLTRQFETAKWIESLDACRCSHHVMCEFSVYMQCHSMPSRAPLFPTPS